MNSLKEENTQLKMGLKQRTEEANSTIIKLAQQMNDTKAKNDEYLLIIEQLSTEVINQQKTNQKMQQTLAHLAQNYQSSQLQHQSHYDVEEVDQLR